MPLLISAKFFNPFNRDAAPLTYSDQLLKINLFGPLDLQIWGGGGFGACPQTPLETRTFGFRIIPVNTNTLPKTSATGLEI